MVPADEQKPDASEHPPAWTDSDKAALEELLKEREHRKWLAERLKGIGRIAQWIAAIGVGATLLWDWFSRIIKAASGP